MSALLLIAVQALTLPPFQSVALHGGGEVVIRHGSAPGASLAQGSLSDSNIRVEAGRLLIDHCPNHCPRGARLRLEVSMPRLASVSVADGGLVRVEAGFPNQPAASASVSSGGAIDLRALPADRVEARIAHGGLIFTRPGRFLDADISQGGGVTFWGNPSVRSSTGQGGVVARGAPRDLDRPFVELQPPAARTFGPMPPVPPVPPVPSLGH